MSGEPQAPCRECGAPLAPAQRYCLSCGVRNGSRDRQLAAVLAAVAEHVRADRLHADRLHADGLQADPLAPATGSAPPTFAAQRAGGLRLPRPRISALLVVGFLGFGVLLGNVASSPPRTQLAAAARQQLKLVLPSERAATATAPATAPSSSNKEPPAAQAEPTPPTASAPAKTTTQPASSSTKTGAKPTPQATSGESEKAAATPAKKLPAIKHVFVIVLSDEPYAAVFGPEAAAGYVTHTLEPRGELLTRYDAVAHNELADELALVSGQGPTAETAADCATYANVAPATPAADEQLLGTGCVYPASTQTLGGQLAAKHLSWRAYLQGSDEPGLTVGACAHPALGAADPTSAPGSGAYATAIDPFVYFHSIIDTPACAADVVGLDRLQSDLKQPATTPSFAYIAPDRCHDGNPAPCTPGAPAGMAAAETFLRTTVRDVTASKAFKEAGLLVITVDQAPASGAFADSSSCCGQPSFPNLPAASSASPRGGGAVGALLLSPFVKAASTSQEPFNHFSLLRTVEDLFSLAHLGYAALPAVKSFPAELFLSHAQ